MDALRGLVLSEARAKVLTALFLERGRTFYQTELARATGLPIVAVQRQLKRLVAAGLVSTSMAGGRRVYSADPRSAVFDEVSSIVRKLRGPATALRPALKTHRVDLAFVFGSFASGSAAASSDIDLMVLGRESTRVVRGELTKAERDLGRSVNEHVMTAREWTARLRKEDPFLTNVRAGPKLWVIGAENALAQLDPPRLHR
ncbi:MAG: winged helix-turn-helix transcriptional regulator [Chloroflexi bacterium]|nr:MAG: winged helix-turn-helix transcriptional regulator [Chloroflexota bacterium]